MSHYAYNWNVDSQILLEYEISCADGSTGLQFNKKNAQIITT